MQRYQPKAPLGAREITDSKLCRPLRGLVDLRGFVPSGLRPGATFCRHLRWLVELPLINGTSGGDKPNIQIRRPPERARTSLCFLL